MHGTRPSPAPVSADRTLGIDGRRRVVIDAVRPEIDGGRFPIKRTVGEAVTVVADMFADGHDLLAGVVRYRHVPATVESGPPNTREIVWHEVPLEAVGDDAWRASFTVTTLGRYEYTVEGWVDRFGTWLRDLVAKVDVGRNVSSELLEGAELVQAAAARTGEATGGRGLPARGRQPGESLRLLELADKLRGSLPVTARIAAARDRELRRLMDARPDRSRASTYGNVLAVTVDPVVARFGAWYEMFPRSCTSDPERSGTFREAEARLPGLSAMGFDVVYLPPIHPIGSTHRKGPNNMLQAGPQDPGSPWAIGAAEGGHTAIEPGLGTLDDFTRFVQLANRLNLEVALDIALQASPDHPWVREHPEWFLHRPDGTIKHAENPPKKYQDIYPLNFESDQWKALWAALRDVFLFWLSHGVRIFRVDNPHTKSFAFWEWAIREIQRVRPDAIFLAEAFTRPKVMRFLAKAGFSQSYTYFTWKNGAWELREYLNELTRTGLQEFMRPNFFANTPDILHEYLQTGGRPAFEVRLILAATLAASYGIYSGYELCENVAVRPGSEEYVDSEKYQIKTRDWSGAGRFQELIACVNQIRRAHPALQWNATLAFHATDNPAFLFFSKSAGVGPAEAGPHVYAPTEAGPRDRANGPQDRVFVVANTDPHWMQHGWVQMPIWELGLDRRAPYIVEDLLDGARYHWRGEWNYVKLDPSERMAHIFVVRT